MFFVGQKVVCVNNDPCTKRSPNAWWNGDRPTLGQIYTIKRIILDWESYEIVHLVELDRSETAKERFGPDVGYGSYRFRPLIERKTDISIFTQILDSVKSKEPV